MKNVLFVVSLLIQTLIVSGQPYHSIFSSDTTKWNVFECLPDAGGTIVYYSYSDTLINDKVYHIMFRENLYFAEQELKYDKQLCGYVHEDTISGKYWFLKQVDFNNYEEALFMDLSLQKGDTFAVISDFRYMFPDSVIVDSVYYIDNKKIITINKLNYDCYNEAKVQFIEGVGPTYGFYMGEFNEQPEPYTLLCKFDDDVKTYSIDKEYFIDCYHDGGSGVNDDEFGKSISIFPNPSQGKLSILIENFDSSINYEIINTLGRVITKGTLLKSINDLKINENGVFFIRLSNNYYQTTKKVIINGI